MILDGGLSSRIRDDVGLPLGAAKPSVQPVLSCTFEEMTRTSAGIRPFTVRKRDSLLALAPLANTPATRTAGGNGGL